MAGTIGNTNGNKNNRLWADTIRRAVVQADGVRLRRIAEALLDKAAEGDIAAIKEMGDRLDGKVTQVIAGPGENGEHLISDVTISLVKANAPEG